MDDVDFDDNVKERPSLDDQKSTVGKDKADKTDKADKAGERGTGRDRTRQRELSTGTSKTQNSLQVKDESVRCEMA